MNRLKKGVLIGLLSGQEVFIGGETYKLFMKDEMVPYLQDDGTINYEDYGASQTGIFKKCLVTYSALDNPIGNKWLMYASEISQLLKLADNASEEESAIISANAVLTQIAQSRGR